MPRKLKVYRTPIGFHDAYVAASSQQEALRIWGSDTNLFASGQADIVSDAKLTEEPLANPGKIVRISRGTAAEHLAALPKDDKRDPVPKQAPAKKSPAEPKANPPRPRPSRRLLDNAEAALERLQKRHALEDQKFAKEEEALAAKRQHMQDRQREEMAKAREKADDLESHYDRAMDEWRKV